MWQRPSLDKGSTEQITFSEIVPFQASKTERLLGQMSILQTLSSTMLAPRKQRVTPAVSLNAEIPPLLHLPTSYSASIFQKEHLDEAIEQRRPPLVFPIHEQDLIATDILPSGLSTALTLYT